ncbi:transglycosylase [Geotalea uraniireducens]|uniref:Transglycosylase n=1 Tax=Geotalea uraniireducens TaxID=351604 RepID=A0ABN6VSV1_9BACT|nr:biosynthetic peptidoglycan transglycosylase [Geotalea uraniireducens]BDV41247.1 transglycosylase [Geotalea uraniireducens]
MKKKKIVLAILGIILLYVGYIGVSIMNLPSVEVLKNRRMNMTIQVKDWHNNYHSFVVGPKNRYWTASASIPAEMKWAVIVAEDANFYKHEGIDVKAIKNAIKYDLEKKSFARGASTITQQVAKNLFLSREKTISRKIEEVILAKRMEQELTKGRIIELYLNVVELGPMIYGIGHGAHYYFGKSAAALTPRECAFLAAMLPGPRQAYNPYKHLDKVLKRSEMILRLLRSKGALSEDEYRQALAESPNISGMQRKVDESIKQQEVPFTPLSSATVPGQPAASEAPAAGAGNSEQRETPPQNSATEPPAGENVPAGAAAPPTEQAPR